MMMIKQPDDMHLIAHYTEKDGAPEPPGLSHDELYDHPPFEDAGPEGRTNDGNHGTIDEILERAEAKHVAMQAHPMARDVLVISI